MKKYELLSPCGNMESLKAAICAGADAVYLGGKSFGARAFSTNFSNEELISAINYSHLYGVKVYVTVNTLIYDNEVSEFINYIEFLHKNNVDAVIMQDIGMIDLVRKTYPNLEIHASTQMHIHNLEGAKLLEKLGVKRVVLGREVDTKTIKEIKEKTNLEIEIFVHGALCISYSGQCLMSSLVKNRSGNRGMCAGNCRLKYNLRDLNKNKVNKDKYLLSTKDLCTLEYIDKLMEIGVDSFKIEGRMKREEYVYLVTNIYRKRIDNIAQGKNNFSDEDILELKKIYNRKFTKGFLFNEENNGIVNQFRPNHMGIEIGKVINVTDKFMDLKLSHNIHQGDGIRIIGKDDSGFILNYIYKNKKLVNEAFKNDIVSIPLKEKVFKNDLVIKTTDSLQIKEIEDKMLIKRKVFIDGEVIIRKNKNIIFRISDGKNEVEEISDIIVNEAINRPISKEEVKKQLSKLGNTIYEFNNLNIIMDDDVFVLVSDLNSLRRNIIIKLNEKRLYKIPFEKKEYSISLENYPVENSKNVLINSMNIYKEIKDKDYKYIFVSDIDIDDSKVIKKIERVVNKFTNDDNVLVGELGSVNYYKNFLTDFSLNVTNSYSAALLHSLGAKMVTLSYEMSFEDVKSLIQNYENRYHKHPNLEVVVYGKEELMISKFNLPKMYNLEEGYLEDIFGNLYYVKSYDEFMKIYNDKPRNIINVNDYFMIGVNNVRYNYDYK